MDSEFINAYIAKQKALISDLQSKLLIAETTVDILKASNARITEENDKLNQIQQTEKSSKKMKDNF